MAETGDFSKMKLAELKKACKDKGLPISGTKAELLARLNTHTDTGSGDEGSEHEDSLLNEEDEDLKAIEAELDKTDDLDSTLDKSDDNIQVKKDSSPVPKDVPSVAKKAVSLAKTMTESEKLALRAEKFGVVSEDLKKQNRAKKFGSDTQTIVPVTREGVSVKLDDVDRLKKRAERFGDSVSSAMKETTEKERQLKRLERFGGTTSENIFNKKQVKLADEEKKAERAKRFHDAKTSVSAPATSSVDETRRKRAERFGVTTSTTSSSTDAEERKKRRLDRFK